METVEVESVLDHETVGNIKSNDESDKQSLIQVDGCHKTNGVAESLNVVTETGAGDNEGTPAIKADKSDNKIETIAQEISVQKNDAPKQNSEDNIGLGNHTQVISIKSTANDTEVEAHKLADVTLDKTLKLIANDEVIHENVAESLENIVETSVGAKECHLNDVQSEEVVECEVVESVNDNVQFETEILVETNNDITEIEIAIDESKNDSTNNILSNLGENIELSEVLRSSDITDNVENNNCSIRQEVFNNEELLDILEGNDVQPVTNQGFQISSMSEAQLALEQITRLKSSRKTRLTASDIASKKQIKLKQKPNKEEISVNALVKDWDDDEPEEHTLVSNESKLVPIESQNKEKQNENVVVKEEISVDSSTGDNQSTSLNKSSDDGQPQRRLGRVIKKKVIFDPDNPETYTKSKVMKNKDSENEKDQQPPKKAKMEQTVIRAKSKSPVSKMHWKKPPPKQTSKQNKRLTEVEKLLMDEGAVNMIYQLTPEAPKGKKNMRTKAEFIKKLQSSTPEGKEMKFRERKKELIKSEDGESKKILGGKQQSSLSSSVKSPSVSEDFEAHSADDSIIYRRHSSSSYSSSCMSPRRLSDVDTSQASLNSTQTLKETSVSNCADSDNSVVTDMFQPDSSVPNEFFNKDDCMSIKKKINSKLSLALNKRKREIGKSDKPIKKKLIKIDGSRNERDDGNDEDNFKYLTISFDLRLADICIRKTGSKYNVKVLKEIAQALSNVNSRKDISVTLLTSECGTLCSDLDLSSLLQDDIEKRTKAAEEMAEAIRSVVWSAERHSKLLCCGVWGSCGGVGVPLAARCDVTLAGETARFGLPHPPLPGLVALPTNAINDLLIFGRELSASEALQCGLVSRVLWPAGVSAQVQAIVKEIATQPAQSVLLKKKLLNVRKSPESTLLSQLEAEAALMVEYWTSDEGQETLRANNDAV